MVVALVDMLLIVLAWKRSELYLSTLTLPHLCLPFSMNVFLGGLASEVQTLSGQISWDWSI